MGDSDKEVTDEERDQSDEKRSEAMRAFSEQQFDEAIKLYTEAIQLNPQSALLFAKRGQVFFTKCHLIPLAKGPALLFRYVFWKFIIKYQKSKLGFR